MVGASSASGAKRIGGQPDKPLPKGWNSINKKTGEPPGIDKGWGYAPGASVNAEVQQMAEKAAGWSDGLAKAFLKDVPNRMKKALARAYLALPSVADDARRAARLLAGK